jgi:L-ascorbate metabolism protein UlaG (beta-lactamase superfamily)
MKITKFAQSCTLLETKDKKILIDPGYLLLDDATLKKWLNVDIILVTHKHGDHCDDKSINEIMKNPKVKLYTTKEVKESHNISPTKIVKEGDVLNLDGINIEVVKAVHGYIPTFKGKKEIHENISFIINDGSTKVYFTGDIICFNNDYKCDIIFVPVCNHGLVMGAFEAALFAKETGAKLVIPNHYDAPKYPTDLKKVKMEFEKQNLNYKILKIGESITF